MMKHADFTIVIKLPSNCVFVIGLNEFKENKCHIFKHGHIFYFLFECLRFLLNWVIYLLSFPIQITVRTAGGIQLKARQVASFLSTNIEKHIS